MTPGDATRSPAATYRRALADSRGGAEIRVDTAAGTGEYCREFGLFSVPAPPF